MANCSRCHEHFNDGDDLMELEGASLGDVCPDCYDEIQDERAERRKEEAREADEVDTSSEEADRYLETVCGPANPRHYDGDDRDQT